MYVIYVVFFSDLLHNYQVFRRRRVFRGRRVIMVVGRQWTQRKQTFRDQIYSGGLSAPSGHHEIDDFIIKSSVTTDGRRIRVW